MEEADEKAKTIKQQISSSHLLERVKAPEQLDDMALYKFAVQVGLVEALYAFLLYGGSIVQFDARRLINLSMWITDACIRIMIALSHTFRLILLHSKYGSALSWICSECHFTVTFSLA